MNLCCFILSAGKQQRFGNGRLKQLQVFSGETLMDRQLRQMRESGINPKVVAWHEDLLSRHSNTLNTNGATASIQHTLLLTREFWGERNLFLLGDVYFHDPIVDSLTKETRPIRFWMSGSEIYALSFNKESENKIVEAADYCIAKSCDPRMWHLWRRLSKLNIHSHAGFRVNDMGKPLLTERDCFDCDHPIKNPCSVPP